MSDEVVDEVIQKVAEAAPHISSGLMHRREYVGEENPSDEKMMEADVWANEFFKEKITSIDGVGEFASEEEHEITDCGEGLSVAIDPLDGSSNIPTNNLVGTIVCIYDERLPCSGENLVAAFYILYGPLTTVTVAREGQVNEYVIEESPGDDVDLYMASEDIRIEGKNIYGLGGNKAWFDDVEDLESELADDLKLRYGGALVGDFNQMLHHGGVFGYPAKEGYENGKYRILFEGNPMAFIAEAAGGASTNGERSILEVEVDDIHQRTPFYAGQKELVQRVEEHL
ncbi:class 1 fructose-bisphosphatase [Candidatus Nanohalovita haloferacivicina]|uniref:class 1 fructose-bisphosphatase n=1 Tax=Candidatus Nanohalovita haloferacivicina TaxID=2978046 RepID=UPI00325FC42A|nr:Fructose-1,6-bisphosphatase I [Candidatus Nanohalobia archaeon BNXNv]